MSPASVPRRETITVTEVTVPAENYVTRWAPQSVSSRVTLSGLEGPEEIYAMKEDTLLRQARFHSGKTADEICKAAGCTRPTLYRVEAGEVTPKRPLARRLFQLYKGRVPLSHIYDPEFAGQVRAVS